MLSTRGLRRAISSTSPRYAACSYSLSPSRSFARSAVWRIKPGDSSAPQQSRSDAPDHETLDLCASVTAVMAKLPHPVVVVTTLDRTYQAQAAAGVPREAMRHPIARAITVSSFTSLCIRPRPHVMFNITLPSTMYEALVACGDFNVHVLAPDRSGARIASVFTRGNCQPRPHSMESKSSDDVDVDADLGVFAGLRAEGVHHAEIANRDAWHEQFREAKERNLRASASSHEVHPVAQDLDAAQTLKQTHHVPHLHSGGIVEVLKCRLVRAIPPELPNAGQNVILIGEVVDVTFPKKQNENLGRQRVALGYADRKYRSVGDAIHPHETDDMEGKP